MECLTQNGGSMFSLLVAKKKYFAEVQTKKRQACSVPEKQIPLTTGLLKLKRRETAKCDD